MAAHRIGSAPASCPCAAPGSALPRQANPGPRSRTPGQADDRRATHHFVLAQDPTASPVASMPFRQPAKTVPVPAMPGFLQQLADPAGLDGRAAVPVSLFFHRTREPAPEPLQPIWMPANLTFPAYHAPPLPARADAVPVRQQPEKTTASVRAPAQVLQKPVRQAQQRAPRRAPGLDRKKLQKTPASALPTSFWLPSQPHLPRPQAALTQRPALRRA